jgi:hypothetical protein
VAKDAYWFRHDANAHRDTKILRLRAKWEAAGYGTYWMLIELMREQDGGEILRSDLPVFAHDLRFERLEELVDDCCAWNLFEDVNGKIRSARLCREMTAYQEATQKLSDAGRLGASRRWNGQAITTPKPGYGQVIASDSTDRQRRQTEREDKDPIDMREHELGDRGSKGEGDNSPPPADPAGLERPAGPPAPNDADPEEDPEKIAEAVSQQLGPSVIDFAGLPPHLRVATERARLKLDADAKARANHLAEKTSDYHVAERELEGGRYAKPAVVDGLPEDLREALLGHEEPARPRNAEPIPTQTTLPDARASPPDDDDFGEAPEAQA